MPSSGPVVALSEEAPSATRSGAPLCPPFEPGAGCSATSPSAERGENLNPPMPPRRVREVVGGSRA